jgi:uncharacterized phage protein (TIGR01671 family)
MNREIIFRGRSWAGIWVYGYLSFEFGTAYIRHEWMDDSSPSGPAMISVEVDPATVGQYVGPIDKNGNRIFEGDECIFSWERATKGGYLQISDSTVEMKETAYYVWHLTGFALKNSNTGKFVSVPSDSVIEIIGNIHDNFELLNP